MSLLKLQKLFCYFFVFFKLLFFSVKYTAKITPEIMKIEITIMITIIPELFFDGIFSSLKYSSIVGFETEFPPIIASPSSFIVVPNNAILITSAKGSTLFSTKPFSTKWLPISNKIALFDNAWL